MKRVSAPGPNPTVSPRFPDLPGVATAQGIRHLGTLSILSPPTRASARGCASLMSSPGRHRRSPAPSRRECRPDLTGCTGRTSPASCTEYGLLPFAQVGRCAGAQVCRQGRPHGRQRLPQLVARVHHAAPESVPERDHPMQPHPLSLRWCHRSVSFVLRNASHWIALNRSGGHGRNTRV
jgi:hypothetical protein